VPCPVSGDLLEKNVILPKRFLCFRRELGLRLRLGLRLGLELAEICLKRFLSKHVYCVLV